MTVAQDGSLADDVQFFAAWIESKAKLVYDEVSDWLENRANGNHRATRLLPDSSAARLCLSRAEWRQNHALVF